MLDKGEQSDKVRGQQRSTSGLKLCSGMVWSEWSASVSCSFFHVLKSLLPLGHYGKNPDNKVSFLSQDLELETERRGRIGQRSLHSDGLTSLDIGMEDRGTGNLLVKQSELWCHELKQGIKWGPHWG